MSSRKLPPRKKAEIEAKTKDSSAAGYWEAFTREWKPIKENRMADNNEPSR